MEISEHIILRVRSTAKFFEISLSPMSNMKKENCASSNRKFDMNVPESLNTTSQSISRVLPTPPYKEEF